MNYQEVTDYIFNLRRFGDIKLGLDRVKYLLDKLGNPEKNLKYVHIAGTNGKGSVAAMISSILSFAGYKVGTYTSPHLSDFTERIVIRGRKIPENEVVRLVEELKPLIEKMKEEINDQPTFFELVTVMTIKYFREQKVDIAIMEVGLGGRLDATNVITPIVSIITNIDLEHTDILGDDREKIAMEKAGIIKNNSYLVTAVDQNIYKLYSDICKDKNTKIFHVGFDIQVKKTNITEDYQIFEISGFGKSCKDVKCKLIGDHQLLNAGCAFGAVQILGDKGFSISEEAIRKGFENVVWPGRLEIMQRNPTVVLDCAKDPLGMRALRNALTSIFKYNKLITILSVSKDKKLSLMLDEIVPISDTIITTKHQVMGRAFEPEYLAQEISKYEKQTIITQNINEALDNSLSIAKENDLICVTGSVFLVGEARERWHKQVVIWGREMNEVRR